MAYTQLTPVLRQVKGSVLTAEDYDNNVNKIKAAIEETQDKTAEIPAGVLMDFLGTVPPDGWLICDGAEITQSAYPNLYAFAFNNGLLGAGKLFEQGEGENFNLPDLRGKITQMAADGQTVGNENGANSHDHDHDGFVSLPADDHAHNVNTQNIGPEGAGLDVVISVDPAAVPPEDIPYTTDVATVDVQQAAVLVNKIIKT